MRMVKNEFVTHLLCLTYILSDSHLYIRYYMAQVIFGEIMRRGWLRRSDYWLLSGNRPVRSPDYASGCQKKTFSRIFFLLKFFKLLIVTGVFSSKARDTLTLCHVICCPKMLYNKPLINLVLSVNKLKSVLYIYSAWAFKETFHFLSGEEYKTLIEKREEVRKAFHSKMIETAKVITVQLFRIACRTELILRARKKIRTTEFSLFHSLDHVIRRALTTFLNVVKCNLDRLTADVVNQQSTP